MKATMPCSVCGEPGVCRVKKSGQHGLPPKWVLIDGAPTCKGCRPKGDTRNYCYGAWPAPESEAAIDEDMRRGNRYKNALIAIERDRRAKADELLRAAHPDLAELDRQIAEIDSQIRAIRDGIRSRNVLERNKTKGTQAELSQIRSLQARLNELAEARKPLRKAAFRSTDAIRELDESAKARGKGAYDEIDPSWGTRGAVDEACRNLRKGAPPCHKPSAGRGVFAVQLQRGLATEDAFGDDTRFRIVLVPGKATYHCAGRSFPATHHKRPHAVAMMRIGSDERRRPVWASVKFCLHRPLPPGGRIKHVRLIRYRQATHARWKLLLAIDGGTHLRWDAQRQTWAVRSLPVRPGVVAVDIGAGRRMGDGSLRVATWSASDGREGELRLPDLVVWSVLKEASLIQETRKRMFNDAIAAVRRWLATHDAPDWMKEETRHIHQWKSERKLARLVLRWRQNRVPGDEPLLDGREEWRTHLAGLKTVAKPGRKELYQRYRDAVDAAAKAGNIEAWRMRDKHLYEYQAGMLRRAKDVRLAKYREYAREQLNYSEVIIENVDWSVLLRAPAAEHDDEMFSPRRLARLAAPGLLTRCLRECLNVRLVDVRPSTQICHRCGGLCDFDHAAHLVHTCEHCGCEWDQDYNRARNLLFWHSDTERSGDSDRSLAASCATSDSYE